MRRVIRVKRLCECGCKGEFFCREKDPQRFLPYHWSKTEAHRHSDETKKKLSEKKIGLLNPMKRKEVREKVSASLKGKSSWNKGKNLSEDHRKKLIISHIGNAPSYETREKMSESHRREKHWNWMGGKSGEQYAPTFNSQLKERVRVRDNFICQGCGIPELEIGKTLDVHHIDYDKKNSAMENLISLCDSCHSKTNFNREKWKERFSRVIKK